MTPSSGIATSFVVKITERARPVFKKHPFKLVEDELNGAFSSIPYGVFHNEDIRAYIHCNIKKLDNLDILSMYAKHMVDDFGNLKSNFKNLEDKDCIQFVHFPVFDKPEWVRYVLSQIHDEFIWLYKPHMITKQSIQEVTCLNATSEVPRL